MTTFSNIGLLAGVLLVIASPALSATWYIKADGTGDANTIQDGINASSNGDTVLLAEGTYTGVGNYDINFLGKSIVVTVQGVTDKTIIDCQGNGRGFIFNSGETSSSVLNGVRIANANSVGQGGGIFCDTSDPTISFNVIYNCTAGNGGGIYLKKSDAAVYNNTLDGNSSGIHVQANSPSIYNNIITNSTSGQAIRCIAPAAPVMSCNDLWANSGGDALCGIDAGGNASSDPEFCGLAGTNNYYLQADSPCAPANSPCGVLIGAMPVLCSTVPTYEQTWGAIKAIYR